MIFCAFGVLYANTTSLPGLLQSLFGYDATTSGLVLSPAGIGAVLTLLATGLLLARGVDARYLDRRRTPDARAGEFLDVSAEPWRSPPGKSIWPRIGGDRGLVDDFRALNVAAFRNIPIELRGAAVGLLALLRNEGGSVGTCRGQDPHRTTRTVPHPASRENSRPPESRGKFLPRGCPIRLCPANRRSRRRATDGSAKPRQSSPRAGLVLGLLRQLSDGRRRRRGAPFSWVFTMKRAVAEKGAHLVAGWQRRPREFVRRRPTGPAKASQICAKASDGPAKAHKFARRPPTDLRMPRNFVRRRPTDLRRPRESVRARPTDLRRRAAGPRPEPYRHLSFDCRRDPFA